MVKSTDTWGARLVPLGLIGQTRPRHYRELFEVLWENKSDLSYAWNILNHGVCDGCSLGSPGLRDNALDGVHLCTARLKRLRLNTLGALDISELGDVQRLRKFDQVKLRSLGRLSYPMLRRKNHKGFVRIRWDEAFDTIAKSIRGTAPSEMGFFATCRGLTNEVYYVFQKLARALGTNNVDLCSRLCHAASISGLRNTLGLGAATCSLSDFIGTDLLVLFGTDLANNQPVTVKYMHFARKAGTKVIVVSPTREYGRKRYWMPSMMMSAGFGTRSLDDFFQAREGSEIAFVNGVLKALIAANQLDRDFIARHTSGLPELKEALEQQSWEILEQRSGLSRAEMERFARLYGSAKTAVFVYGMGLTQHEFGVENVEAIVNLALARGMVGREKCGIMPIRGDSGVQGGGECGSVPDIFPGGFSVNEESARRFSNLWRHPVSSAPGLTVPHMIEAAHRGEIKFLYSIGGNLFETMPDGNFVAEAISGVPFRVHQDIVLNTSMLLDAEEAVLLLPAQTCYEQRGGGTSTSTDRRIRFTPEIPGHRIGAARPEWEIPALIGRKTMSNGELLFPYVDTQSIREEMARVMPMYQGIDKLAKEGDQLQWGGPYLYKGGFANMPNQRARFTVLEPPDRGTTIGSSASQCGLDFRRAGL